MSTEAIVQVRDLANRFGSQSVHEHLDLDIYRGEILAVVAQTVRVLRDLASNRSAMDAQLRRQVDHVNHTTVWPVRSREWSKWLP